MAQEPRKWSTSEYVTNRLNADPINTALWIKEVNDWWDSTLPIELEYQKHQAAKRNGQASIMNTFIDDDGREWEYLSKDNHVSHIRASDGSETVEGIPNPDTEGNGAFKTFILAYDGAKFTPEIVTANHDLLIWAERIVDYFSRNTNLIEGNDFMLNMVSTMERWDRLTPGQAKGVLNWYRAHVKHNNKTEVHTSNQALDISGLPTGMYADPLHIEQYRAMSAEEREEEYNHPTPTRLKLAVNNLILGMPWNLKDNKDGTKVVKDMGKWSGWVFVNDGAQYGRQQKYGSQKPGQTYVGNVQDVLARIIADPIAAASAYGYLTAHCGVCGRPLEDEESVARGIGPTCYSKM